MKEKSESTDKKVPDEYARLRDMIVRGDVLPNERLIEAEYAEKLGTNRANIRSALARLEQEGLVVCEPFKGARVRLMTPEEAIEIYEMRGVLEVLVAGRAAQLVAKPDFRVLDERLKKLKDALKSQDALLVGARARRIREELWRISEHTTATRLLEMLQSQMVRIWYQSILMPGRAQEVVAAMEAVVAAVKSQDVTGASKAMKRYHEGAIASLRKAQERKLRAETAT